MRLSLLGVDLLHELEASAALQLGIRVGLI